MAQYERYVHIVMRAGQVRAVISRAKAARESLEYMRSNSMPTFDPDEAFVDYMKKCADETAQWRVERWPIVNTMTGT